MFAVPVTKFTRARTTQIGGPSTGKIFGTARIKIGSGKHLHSKIYPSRTLFFGTRTIFIRAVPKIRCSVNGPLTSDQTFLDYFVFSLWVRESPLIAG